MLQLHRPKQLNSLNSALIEELINAMNSFTGDSNVKVVVITGNEKAFAGATCYSLTIAGADIAEMADKGLAECIQANFLSNWDLIRRFRKPLIAAVNGYAVGNLLHDLVVGRRLRISNDV